jgi:hypothetical protein
VKRLKVHANLLEILDASSQDTDLLFIPGFIEDDFSSFSQPPEGGSKGFILARV